ncbi:hypothetical protein [Alicyclobacillus mengziensis]|uniref:Lipoprotein n=1 Tax=Alicyclobacillus mengziensis TaxID=2931921 RepID=A0A9X7VYD4_9BACL|nr:hypothetical protein [Alicyclobacillus mengziensis]QSO47366.1 hypothetical protein JZ786_23760 [Alicyclobacillus mengziensis]
MKRYKQLATAGIAFSIVGLLAGCATGNNTTSTNATPTVTKTISDAKNTTKNTSNSFTAEKAIANVNPVLGTLFPSTLAIVHGKIGVGGPNPSRTIPATLQTKVQKISTDTYLVTFTEKWSTSDFVENDANHGITSKHTWKYKVSPSHSNLVSQSGDFPPQSAR